MIQDAPDPLLALGVSRETNDRLEALVEVLRKWNPAINLVSSGTLNDAWTRHIIDSAQLFRMVESPTARWADLGSGGGFPGLVIGCIAAEFDPEMEVVLVESDQRKATFLRQASRELGLSVRVLAERIEKLAPLEADVVSARALAPLATLCRMAARHLKADGVALFPKGSSHGAEIDEAMKDWRFDLEVLPSFTERGAAILKLKGLNHA